MKIHLTSDQLGDVVDLMTWHCNDAQKAVRADYSGRGMYGKTCIGVIGGPSELIAFTTVMDEIAEDYDWPEDLDWMLAHPHLDSMGLDSIYYWPSITADANAEEVTS